MNQTSYDAPPELETLQRRCLRIGIGGMAVCVVGLFFSPAQFFRSYLLGYVFWTGIALGCLAIVMLHHLSGGAWGLVIRRLLESGTRTLPLMVLLFIPIALGRESIYSWAVGANVAASELLQHKRPYLNIAFFLVRTTLYFAAWLTLTYYLNKWSEEQDRTADPGLTRRFENLSGPGLVLYGLTVTFASVDWVMSLEPEWFSTIFGVLFMGGQALSAMAFVIALGVLLSGREPFSAVILPSHLHDLGKLMLALVMLWAYFAFSQFLIIWSGNLPEEIPWYVHRTRGGWQWIGLALIAFHFAAPFLLLLSRDLKRNARMLAMVALAVIVMRFVDLFWLIAPEFHHDGVSLHFMDLAAPIGIGGLWLAFFSQQLRARPLLPVNDPYLEEALRHGKE
jgi:hypothetical protein